MPSHYEILGVTSDASPEVIRKAYIRRARALHPDRQMGRTPSQARAAEEAMRQVNAAWTVLSDASKKAEYDRRSRPAAPRVRPEAPTPRTTVTRRPETPVEPVRSAEPRVEEAPVSIWSSIPVLLIIGVLLAVLVITAFADREPADNRPVVDQPATRFVEGDCFELVGSTPRARSCDSGASDGLIVDVVPARGNCPQQTTALADPTSELFLCWARMLPGSTNTVPPSQ